MIKNILIFSITLSFSLNSMAQCSTAVFSDTTISNTTDTVYINTHYENIWICEGMNVIVLSAGNMWIEKNCHVEILGGASVAYIKAPGYLRFHGSQFFYEPGITKVDINDVGRRCDTLTFDYSNVSSNGCTVFSSVEEEESVGFTLFPNPNNGIFSISSYSSKRNILSIYNLMGEIVLYENNSNDGKSEINLQAFPKGIYLVELRYETKIFSEKILIQ